MTIGSDMISPRTLVIPVAQAREMATAAGAARSDIGRRRFFSALLHDDSKMFRLVYCGAGPGAKTHGSAQNPDAEPEHARQPRPADVWTFAQRRRHAGEDHERRSPANEGDGQQQME